jgi:ABC-type branched-subunit amino acid transport system substrate-binding protein
VNMNNKRILPIWWPVVVSFAIALGSTSCGKVKSDERINIAAILPLTGAAAEFGNIYAAGLRLFVDDFSQSVNIKCNLVISDSKTSPKDAVAAYQQYRSINGPPAVLFTELSSVSMALAPLLSADNVAMITVATAPDLKQFANVIRIYPDASQIAATLLSPKLKSFYDKGLTVVYQNDDFGRSVAAEVSNIATSISPGLSATLEPMQSGIDPKLMATKHAGAGAVVIVAIGQQLGSLIRAFREAAPGIAIIAPPETNFESVRNIITLPDDKLFVASFAPLPKGKAEEWQRVLGRRINALDQLVYDGVQLFYGLMLPEGVRGTNAIQLRGRATVHNDRRVEVGPESTVMYLMALEHLPTN